MLVPLRASSEVLAAVLVAGNLEAVFVEQRPRARERKGGRNGFTRGFDGIAFDNASALFLEARQRELQHLRGNALLPKARLHKETGQ